MMALTSSNGGKFDLSEVKSVHVVGAGGAGMNAIAAVLLASGYLVSGSDLRESAGVNRLRSLGARIAIGHSAGNLDGPQILCRSTAVPDDNPEIVEARRLGINVLSRAEILAAICATKKTVAVSGTHGKTTTSSMLALALTDSGLMPSFIVGGDLNDIGSGAVWNERGDLFVVEADESDGTFLQLKAEAAVVTNVEADHLDYFGSYEALLDAFEVFLRSASGPRVVCADDPSASNIAAKVGGCITYGQSSLSNYRIEDIEGHRYSSSFKISFGNKVVAQCNLPIPGVHNVLNATAAFVTAVELGADPESVTSALGKFAGVARRFEFRGEQNNVVYVDDYAHLPTEVSSVLAAAKVGEWQRVVAVFQPHRFSRTANLWKDFADSFVDADHVVLTGIYGAGETAQPGITGELVARAVLEANPHTSLTYISERNQVAEYLDSVLQPGDLCLTMGAGDLTSVADEVQHRRKALDK